MVQLSKQQSLDKLATPPLCTDLQGKHWSLDVDWRSSAPLLVCSETACTLILAATHYFCDIVKWIPELRRQEVQVSFYWEGNCQLKQQQTKSESGNSLLSPMCDLCDLMQEAFQCATPARTVKCLSTQSNTPGFLLRRNAWRAWKSCSLKGNPEE